MPKSTTAKPIKPRMPLRDRTDPATPTNLAAVAVEPSTVTLTWSQSTDPTTTDNRPTSGVAGYRIFKLGSVVQTVVGASVLTTDILNLSPGNHGFNIASYDFAGNQSPISSRVDVQLVGEEDADEDTTAPEVPASLVASNIGQTSLTISWAESSDPDVPGAITSGDVSYDIYDGTIYVATTGSLSYTVTGLTADTEYEFTVIAVDGAGNESAASSVLTVSTEAEPMDGPELTVGSGKLYSTIQAAVNVAVPGDIIEVYDGTYSATVNSVRNGTAADPIILRAAAGQTPIIQGTATNQVTMSHTYLEWGEGIEVRGQNTGTTTSYTASGQMQNGVYITADRCVAKFKIRKVKLSGYKLEEGVDYLHVLESDVETIGTLNRGDGNDAGEGFRVPENRAGGSLLIEDSRFNMGGHNAFQMRTDPALVRELMCDQSGWEAITFGAQTGLRARCAGFWNGDTRTVIERSCFLRAGLNVDANGTLPNIRIESKNVLIRECLLSTNNSTGSLQNFISASTSDVNATPGAKDCRVAHVTYFSASGTAINCIDNLGVNYGPFYWKNILLRSISGQRAIHLRYDSTRTGFTSWQNLFYFDGIQSDSDYNVRIQDDAGVVAQVNMTLTQLEAHASYGDNFKNVTIQAPSFASQTLPSAALLGGAAFTSVETNFLPSAPVAGVPLTLVATGGTGVRTITLVDAKWFRDDMGWSHLAGDTVYLEGHGSAVIQAITGNQVTFTANVTVANGADVFLGDSGTPNMGAVL